MMMELYQQAFAPTRQPVGPSARPPLVRPLDCRGAARLAMTAKRVRAKDGWY